MTHCFGPRWLSKGQFSYTKFHERFGFHHFAPCRISPETGTGEHLLREVNLLSHKANVWWCLMPNGDPWFLYKRTMKNSCKDLSKKKNCVKKVRDVSASLWTFFGVHQELGFSVFLSISKAWKGAARNPEKCRLTCLNPRCWERRCSLDPGKASIKFRWGEFAHKPQAGSTNFLWFCRFSMLWEMVAMKRLEFSEPIVFWFWF